MRRLLSLSIPFVLALLAPAQSGASAGKAASEPDPDIAESIAKIQEAVQDRRMERDGEVVAELKKLAAAVKRPDLNEKDRDDIRDIATAVLARGPMRPPGQIEIYRGAAQLLGRMEEEGARVLRKVYDSSRFPQKPDWWDVRAAIVRAVGETEDLHSVEFLLDEATRADEPKILAAAGEALGHFSKADQRVRKQIAQEMITKFAGIQGEAREPVINRPGEKQNFGPQNAARKLAAMRQPWNQTLQRITGAEITAPDEWQHWWNKNKNRPW